jgi:hypothetical protein
MIRNMKALSSFALLTLLASQAAAQLTLEGPRVVPPGGTVLLVVINQVEGAGPQTFQVETPAGVAIERVSTFISGWTLGCQAGACRLAGPGSLPAGPIATVLVRIPGPLPGGLIRVALGGRVVDQYLLLPLCGGLPYNLVTGACPGGGLSNN